VPEFCRRLDHLPLALELGAARVKALSPDALLTRLERRLPLLVGGARDAPERQRTLRGAIDWSYELLSDEEQRLFRGLAVFVGGCTLEAAEVVCEARVDLLASLVDKSLLRRAGDRYSMLATVREYALERLGESGELESLKRRHAGYFLPLAREINHARGLEQFELLVQVMPDDANLYAAAEWLSATGPVVDALEFVVQLEPYWWTREWAPERAREDLAGSSNSWNARGAMCPRSGLLRCGLPLQPASLGSVTNPKPDCSTPRASRPRRKPALAGRSRKRCRGWAATRRRSTSLAVPVTKRPLLGS
jgi:predicted ATPase